MLPSRRLASAAGGGGGSDDFIHIREEQPQNTQSGTFALGARRTRVLNTEKADTGSHATLASNQITLAAGTYRCLAFLPAFSVAQHIGWLYDTTGTADLLQGQNAHANTTNGAGTVCVIAGRFTIGVQSVLELQHQSIATYADHGFGIRANLATEVYTEIMLWKEQ